MLRRGLEVNIKKIEGAKFKNPYKVDKFFTTIPKPDIGYNKTNTKIYLNSGDIFVSFRYDHGHKDPIFSEQLEWYIENNISYEED